MGDEDVDEVGSSIDLDEDDIYEVVTSLEKLESCIYLQKKDLCYYTHHHPLILSDDHDHDHDEDEDGSSISYCCYSCNLPIIKGTSFFKCNDCIPTFSLHKSCNNSDEFPQQIFHPLHPKHPLKYSSLDYAAFQITKVVVTRCKICSEPNCGPTYSCTECKFNIHRVCAKLHLEIQNHHLHLPPDHTLSLLALPSPPNYYCNACGLKCPNSAYSCSECRFYLHVWCILRMPYIDVGKNNHIHKLILFNSMSGFSQYSSPSEEGYVECDTCNNPINFPPFGRCAECALSYHVHCVFPLKIKTQNHVHSLMVNQSRILPANYDDGSGVEEFYCDACEELRSPCDIAYSCLECEYVAHVGCAFSKEVSILKEDPLFKIHLEDEDQFDPLEAKVIEATKESIRSSLQFDIDFKERKPTSVEDYKIANRENWLTLGKMLKRITKDELEEMRNALEVEETKMVDARDIFLKDYQENNGKNKEKDVAFKEFLERLESQTQSPSLTLGNSTFDETVSGLSGNMIPDSLMSTFRDLRAKNGDISANCALSETMKMCVAVIVCDTMESMCKTLVLEITDSLLFTWWNSFKFAQHAGFQVQFAFDRLKRLLRAQYFHHSKAFTDIAIAKTDKEIDNLSGELVELEEICGPHRAFTRSIFINKWLSEASALEEQNACIILF